MNRLTVFILTMFFGLTLLGTESLADHHENPCNPCASAETANPGNPCNPCAANPCNPCAANPCNPCAANPCNPCAANPCNPCAANPCNPCAANPCNPCAAKTHFTIGDDRNVFSFESKAPLETIVGRTSKVTGKISVNPSDISSSAMAEFVIHLASITTGIGLRDQHMREGYLETDKYPTATLTLDKLTKVSKNKLEDMQTVRVEADATLELHGVKRRVTLKDVKVTFFKESEDTQALLPGNLLRIEGGFTVRLGDYNLKRPQVAFLKVSEDIKISVSLFGSSGVAGNNPCNPCAANPCNPCAGNPCNPCAANPCNPCAGNPCNPCAANPCNPCAGNPCNPCAANPCNPCAANPCNPSNPCNP